MSVAQRRWRYPREQLRQRRSARRPGPSGTAGPAAPDGCRLSTIPYYTFKVGTFAGCPEVILSNTGYTGAGGFEIYFYPQYGEKIWNAIFEAGKPEGIRPIGLGARDTLRLEVGFCLYGNDICDTTSPLEAGLGWITKLIPEKNFPSKAFFEQQKAEGIKRKLVAFKLSDKGVPRSH